MNAIDTVLAAAEAHGEVKRVGAEFVTNCPAHPDEHPSLRFREMDDGKVTVKCWSKDCAFKAIAEGWGLREQDFFPPKVDTAKHDGRGPCVGRWDFEESAGKVRYQVRRYQHPGASEKEFQPFRPDGKGGWIGNLKGVTRIPYRLPELNAAGPDEPIFMFEGEKKTDVARAKLGIVATCNCGGRGGAAQWETPAFQEVVKGRDVVLIPDHDEPGEKHVATVAPAIVRVTKSVRIVRLPLKNQGDDIVEWIEAGGTREQLDALVAAAPLWTPQASAATTETPGKLTFRSTDGIPEEPITWVWDQQLALAVATLWSADPGAAKTLLSLDIAAHVSTGRRLPGNSFMRTPAHVLLVNYEDDLAKSIVPRLRVARADLSMVHALDFATSEITLPDSWGDIASEIARWKAELVIIDPIQAFFARDLSSNNDADVRKALRDGVTVARAHNCAMLWIRHCNKLQNVGALAKGGGSIGFTGIVRHEAMLGQAEEDPDGRIIACVKSNLSRKPPSRAFKIAERDGVPFIEWGDTCATSADDLARASGRQDKGADAAVLLQEALAAGPRRQKEIESLAKEKHLGWRTVQAAKKALDVKSQKLDGAWWWTLPPTPSAALHPCALGTPRVVPFNNNNYLNREGCNTATPQERNDVGAPSTLRPSLADEDPEVIS
jgi:AAA domain